MNNRCAIVVISNTPSKGKSVLTEFSVYGLYFHLSGAASLRGLLVFTSISIHHNRSTK